MSPTLEERVSALERRLNNMFCPRCGEQLIRAVVASCDEHPCPALAWADSQTMQMRAKADKRPRRLPVGGVS